eukprot:g71715.t1
MKAGLRFGTIIRKKTRIWGHGSVIIVVDHLEFFYKVYSAKAFTALVHILLGIQWIMFQFHWSVYLASCNCGMEHPLKKMKLSSPSHPPPPPPSSSSSSSLPCDAATLDDTEAPLLFTFGNPCVDCTVVVNEAQLAALGLRPGQEAAAESAEFKARVVQAVLSQPHSAAAGGSALNTACVAASCRDTSGQRLCRAALLGAVGCDAHAELIVRTLARKHVRPLLQHVPAQPTAVCACLVSAGSRERSLAMARGAAGQVGADVLLQPDVASALREARLVYLTAFVLTTTNRLALARELAAHCTRTGTALALNLSAAALIPALGASLLSLLPRARFVFATRGPAVAVDPLCELSRTLARSRGEVCAAVITNGPHPTHFSLAAHKTSQFSVVAHKTSQSSVMAHKTSQSSVTAHKTSQSSVMAHKTSQSSVMAHKTSQSSVMAHKTSQSSVMAHKKAPMAWLIHVSSLCRAVCRVPVPPVPHQHIHNTNGCGDAFVGGFLARATRALSQNAGEPIGEAEWKRQEETVLVQCAIILTILYYTTLYYTTLYYTILYYTKLYYTILYYTILYYTILYYTILYYTILYYTILYYTILYHTIPYYTILYHTIPYYTILYHTIL